MASVNQSYFESRIAGVGITAPNSERSTAFRWGRKADRRTTVKFKVRLYRLSSLSHVIHESPQLVTLYYAKKLKKQENKVFANKISGGAEGVDVDRQSCLDHII